MASPKKSTEDGRREKDLKEIVEELRSAKHVIFDITRPVDAVLQKLALFERKYIDDLHCIKTERHDREKQLELIQRFEELKSELERVRRENESAKRENAEQTGLICKLKQSLYQATRQSRKQLQKLNELKSRVVEQQELYPTRTERSETLDKSRVGEQEKRLSQTTGLLNKTKRDLDDMRQRLSEVQERLTISEQVTAATQQRELQQSDDSDQLQLLQPNQQHVLHSPQTVTVSESILRACYSSLTHMLDARSVAVNLYQRNALTLKELQSIQSLKDRPVEAAETLLNIILQQPDAVYLCFLDVLKHTQQQHIYQKLIECGFTNLLPNGQSSHTGIIRTHYVYLLESLDVKISGLIHQLYSDQVVSAAELEDIRAEMTSFRANEKLLSALSRKSTQQFQLFLDCLDKCGQQHVRYAITDLSVPVAVPIIENETPNGESDCDVINANVKISATVATQTDEDIPATEDSFQFILGALILHYLAHNIVMTRGNLPNELVTKGVISPSDKQKIMQQRQTNDQLVIMLKILRKKSASQFEGFLETLSDTGQQPVSDVVHQALHGVGDIARNPLYYACVGETVHELPVARPVVGVTSLGDKFYMLRLKGADDQIEVYDATTLTFQRCLTVPNASAFNDMTSCEQFRCLYIADYIIDCIHRIGVDDKGRRRTASQWAVGGGPEGLSVTPSHTLLVTCPAVRKIKELSPRGDMVREMTMPNSVATPWHAVQLRSGQLLVCHGVINDLIHRVVLLSDDGQLVRSHGGRRGSSSDQYNVPRHLAVDDNEFVFVVDLVNERLQLLSPRLHCVHQIATTSTTRDQLNWNPVRLCLDTSRRRLYVAKNEWKDGNYTAGRVVVLRF